MSDTDSSASSGGSIHESASEPDTTSFKCLFCSTHFSHVPTMSAHCDSDHAFDLDAAVKRLGPGADELSVIKLVNFVRAEAAKGVQGPDVVVPDLAGAEGDAYLAPTLQDDALLFELGDLMPAPQEGEKVADYEAFEAALYTQRDIPADLDLSKLGVGGSTSGAGARDDAYFDSYKGNSIHREMIEDRVRTAGYRDFVEQNRSAFKDKVVLDVGCGTGILSLFCARAGAKKVFGVDNSGIAERAREIVEKNGFGGVVQVIRGRVEDFSTQRVLGAGREKVDVIISEWMGYGLLFEGMLDSVLRAKDLYLKPDGLMVPSHCGIRLAPVSDVEWVAEQTGEAFWKDVYGFDFSPMVQGGMLNTHEIGVFDVPAKALCGSANAHWLEMKSVKVKDLSFKIPLEIRLDRDIDVLHAIAIWFDTAFLAPGSTHTLEDLDGIDWGQDGIPSLGFSTGPRSTPTHWHQAVLLLDQEIAQRQKWKKGDVLRGTLEYAKEKGDERGITVTVEWKGEGPDGVVEGRVRRSMA